MTNHTPAEVFPPGEILREELEARGWSQLDFAEIIGKSPRLISEVISGKRAITPETAHALAEALGTSADFWMKLESAYRLSRVERSGADKAISRRAQLYTYPIRDMVRRGWLSESSNIEVLEHQLSTFFRAKTISDLPHFEYAAKKTDYSSLSPSQYSWLFRVKQLAEVLKVPSYSEKVLRDRTNHLRSLLHEPDEIKHVPRILAEAGVRYLIVEGLPGSKIDGVCFWLNKSAPVIAMSIRYDRIDNYWFVLRHEIEHVMRKHGMSHEIIDIELEGDRALASGDIPEEEKVANAEAANFCVPDDEMADFIARVGPYYSTDGVVNFAKRIGVHPGLVVGQLHGRKELHFSYLRKFLVRILEYIIPTAFVDGWGVIPQLALPGDRRSR